VGRSAIDSNVRWSWLLPLTLVLACAACGDDSGDDDDAPSGGSGAGESCTRGTSWSCFGPGNCAGIQLCGPDLVFLPCRCNDTTGGGGDRDGGGSGDAAVPPRDSGSDPEDAATRDAQTEPDAALPPAEDCDNDVDDDQDGDADCADDDCTARTCVEEAPAGWSGPVLLYEGAAPPECSGGYPDEAARGGTAVTAGAASCSTCSCTPADPGCASFLNFETSTASACDDANACSTSINSSCAVLMSPCFTTPTGYVETHLAGTPPTCAPSAQDPTLPDANWDAHAIACGPDHALQRAGCDSGEVCAPEPAFDGAFCIVDDGDVDCPAGPYTDRRVYFTDIADTRNCSDCSCTHDCSYTWRVFDAADATCATPLLTLTQANQCASVTPSAGTIRVNVSIAGTGECAPSGGAPTGSAEGDAPITACCLPD
jgi:hypothetical protein